jgi:hypothetical protein
MDTKKHEYDIENQSFIEKSALTFKMRCAFS